MTQNLDKIPMNDKENFINNLKEKYVNIKKNNEQNKKEIDILNKVLQHSFANDKFNDYIKTDFLDNVEYKNVFGFEGFYASNASNFRFPPFNKKLRNKNKNKTNLAFDGQRRRKQFK